MIPESGEKSYGKEKGSATWDVSEAVLQRGISAVQLAAMLGTTYKTAWSMLRRIRTAMGQRDETHQLCGAIEFDDAYFGGPTTRKKRGRGTEKAKVFVALSLEE